MPLGCGWLLMVFLTTCGAGSGQEAVANGHTVITGVFSLVLSQCGRPSPISRVLLWATPSLGGFCRAVHRVSLTPSWPVGRMGIYERENRRWCGRLPPSFGARGPARVHAGNS